MSDSLVWLLVKNNNAFLHKRFHTKRAGAVQFSSEPGNLLSVNSFKYSGIANSKTIDLSVNDQAIELRLKVRVPEFLVSLNVLNYLLFRPPPRKINQIRVLSRFRWIRTPECHWFRSKTRPAVHSIEQILLLQQQQDTPDFIAMFVLRRASSKLLGRKQGETATAGMANRFLSTVINFSLCFPLVSAVNLIVYSDEGNLNVWNIHIGSLSPHKLAGVLALLVYESEFLCDKIFCY